MRMLEWDFNESHWVIQSFQINVAEKNIHVVICLQRWSLAVSHLEIQQLAHTSLSLYNQPIIMQPTFPSVPRGWFLLLLAHLPVSLSQLRAQWWGRERAAAVLLIQGTGWNHERAPGGREHWGEVFEVSKGNRPWRDTCWKKVLSMIWILNTFIQKISVEIIAMRSNYHTYIK